MLLIAIFARNAVTWHTVGRKCFPITIDKYLTALFVLFIFDILYFVVIAAILLTGNLSKRSRMSSR